MKPFRRLLVAIAIMACLLVTLPGRNENHVLAATHPEITLNVQDATPRQVEDTTQRAVARDYAAAWQALASALDQNRPDLLAGNFIGTANEKLAQTIRQQRKAGLHQRFVDKGHQVNAIFYSPEGSAIELQDTAQFANSSTGRRQGGALGRCRRALCRSIDRGRELLEGAGSGGCSLVLTFPSPRRPTYSGVNE